MALSPQEIQEIRDRFIAAFGYGPKPIGLGSPSDRAELFYTWALSILDDPAKSALVKVCLRGPSRNKHLRRFALVEYRCHRGCLLGAYIKLKGEDLIFTNQIFEIDEGVIDWDSLESELEEMAQASAAEYGSRNSSGLPSLEEKLVMVKKLCGRVDIYPVTDAKEFRALPALAPTLRPGWRVYPLIENERYNMNCNHVFRAQGALDFLEDARKLARQSKKVVRVQPEGI